MTDQKLTLAPAQTPNRCDGCARYVALECEATPDDPVCNDATILVESEGGEVD